MSAPDLTFARPNGAMPLRFPRAADDLSATYMTDYRTAHKATMRAWVDSVLVGLPFDKHHLAHGITYQAAKTELGRPMRTPEHRLLAEATRDWLVVREAKQAAGARV